MAEEEAKANRQELLLLVEAEIKTRFTGNLISRADTWHKRFTGII